MPRYQKWVEFPIQRFFEKTFFVPFEKFFLLLMRLHFKTNAWCLSKSGTTLIDRLVSLTKKGSNVRVYNLCTIKVQVKNLFSHIMNICFQTRQHAEKKKAILILLLVKVNEHTHYGRRRFLSYTPNLLKSLNQFLNRKGFFTIVYSLYIVTSDFTILLSIKKKLNFKVLKYAVFWHI